MNHLTLLEQVHACPPEELAALSEVLGEWFAPGEPVSLREEYPLLFQDHPAVRHYVARGDGGEPLSHAALLVRHVVSGPARLRIGMISCVATKPSERGKGLASLVVNRAVESAREKHCALVLLWSELEGFYERLGFRRMGKEWIFLLAPQAFEGSPFPEPIPYEDRFASQVWALHQRRTIRVERSREEMEALLAIPGTRTWLARGADGEIGAYACIGKGRDFQGVIHEAGGEPRLLEALLGSILSRSGESIPFLASPLEVDLAAALARRGIHPSQGALGLGILLDTDALAHFTRSLGPLAQRFQAPGPLVPFHLPGLDSV